MNLDRWLGKDLTNSILTPPNSEECIPKKVRKPIRVPARTQNPRAQLYRARRGARPSYAAVALRQLQFFTSSVATVEKRVHTVTGLACHDVLCAGLDGEVLLFDSMQRSYGSIELAAHGPVRDLCAYGSNLVVCTDDSVSVASVATPKILSSLKTNEKAFGFQKIALEGNLAVTGTKAGTAYICDMRLGEITSTIWDAHDPHRRSRQCQQPRGPALTAVEWCGDKTVATASAHNQTVKFWDLRKHTVPVNEVTMAQRAPMGGITALRQDADHKLWALGRNGALESMLPAQELVVDIYGFINTPNYSTGLTVIDSPRLATGMIAAGGTDGITVLTRPTLNQSYDYDNAMLAHKWETPGEFSSVYWHQYSSTLVAAGHGTTDCFFWRNL